MLLSSVAFQTVSWCVSDGSSPVARVYILATLELITMNPVVLPSMMIRSLAPSADAVIFAMISRAPVKLQLICVAAHENVADSGLWSNRPVN